MNESAFLWDGSFMTIKGHVRAFGIIWAVVLLVGACGYRFPGASAPQPSIEIPVFSNNTTETGIESVVTESMIEEMNRAPQWRVVPTGSGRYVLEGIISNFYVSPLRVSTSHVAVEDRAVLTLRVTLRDSTTGKVIWRDVSLRDYEDYTLGDDVLTSERNRLEAVSQAAQRLAQRVRRMIQDTFALGIHKKPGGRSPKGH